MKGSTKYHLGRRIEFQWGNGGGDRVGRGVRSRAKYGDR